jgi:hypothetical protein
MMIALMTEEGEHLGYVMCHPEDPRGGTCDFSVVPGRASLFDHPVALRLFRRREVGRSRFALSGDVETSVVVESPGLPRLQIDLDARGQGTWGEGDGDFFAVLGQAQRRSRAKV